MTTVRTTWLAQIAVVLVLLAAGTASASSGLLSGNSPLGKNSLEGGLHQGLASVSAGTHQGYGEFVSCNTAGLFVAPQTLPLKVTVTGEPLVDTVRGVKIRVGLYDPETGTVHVGGGSGHAGLARDTNIYEKSLSGLEIVESEGGISFRQRSGLFDRPLSSTEQEAVRQALESRLGKPVTYDPNLGSVNRPGGAP